MFQELVYTGYKKYHSMKFQSLVMLNSLLVHLNGPYHMPQNNVGMLTESKLLITLEQHAIQPGSDEGDPPEHHFFQIYGNLSYGLSPMMVSPFSGVGELMVAQWEWNVTMGQVQISVEHGFGLVFQDWSYLNAFWKQNVWGTACGVWYWVGVLLTNAHSFLVPNQTAIWYGCMVPSLHQCFHD